MVPNSNALLAIFHSIASIRLCLASCSGSDASWPKRRICHSSGVHRMAEHSSSSFLASVVFPEKGSPTIKWRVATLILPQGVCGPTACRSYPFAISVALYTSKGNVLRGTGPPGRLHKTAETSIHSTLSSKIRRLALWPKAKVYPRGSEQSPVQFGELVRLRSGGLAPTAGWALCIFSSFGEYNNNVTFSLNLLSAPMRYDSRWYGMRRFGWGSLS